MLFNNGLTVEYSYGNLVEDNLVNGRPLVYLENVSNFAVNDAGQVVLVNCSNIQVMNLDLSRASIGVQLWGTNGTTISHSNMTANRYFGIFIRSFSNYNTLNGNNITSNYYGICVDSSSNYNSIFKNNVAENSKYGIYLDSSAGNRIFHNNFINNADQVGSYHSFNIWTDDYPSGGNYWSDYTGVDRKNGFLQNGSESDGIGDTPLIFDSSNLDNYPLMGPSSFFEAWKWDGESYFVDIISNVTISHFNFDPNAGPFVRFWVSSKTESEALGFCRVTIPKDLLWSEDGWIIYCGSVKLENTIILGENCTYLYFTYSCPNANSYSTITINGTHAIPESQSITTTALLMLAIMLSAVFLRRKRFTSSPDANN